MGLNSAFRYNRHWNYEHLSDLVASAFASLHVSIHRKMKYESVMHKCHWIIANRHAEQYWSDSFHIAPAIFKIVNLQMHISNWFYVAFSFPLCAFNYIHVHYVFTFVFHCLNACCPRLANVFQLKWKWINTQTNIIV